MTQPSLPLHIDSTMISCFRSCHQRFYKEFVQGLRTPGKSIDLHAGGCFAAAIEDVNRGIFEFNLDLRAALGRARLFYEQRWGDVEVPEHKRRYNAKSKERVWDAVWVENPTNENQGYINRYSPRTDHVQPYFATDGRPTFEYTFAIPLEPAIAVDDGRGFPLHPSGSPFIYVGRCDRVGHSHGRTIWLDEKTGGKGFDDRWYEQWVLRSQFIGYTWALRQCGIPVDHGLCRGIGILKELIHHIESPPLDYSQVVINRWHEQLRRDLWKLRRCYDEGYWDYNFGETCTAYGSCIFIEPCQSANPDGWNTKFEVRHWNPLHKDPTT